MNTHTHTHTHTQSHLHAHTHTHMRARAQFQSSKFKSLLPPINPCSSSQHTGLNGMTVLDMDKRWTTTDLWSEQTGLIAYDV